jgi:hypothetical protein
MKPGLRSWRTPTRKSTASAGDQAQPCELVGERAFNVFKYMRRKHTDSGFWKLIHIFGAGIPILVSTSVETSICYSLEYILNFKIL